MKQKSCTQEVLVIEKSSKVLVSFLDKLRNKKISQIEELRNKKNFYFPNSK